MNIFFFGGAFNPPHNGHYEIVMNCLKYADKFIIIPNKLSPNKKLLIDSRHRVNMLNLMFNQKNVDIDTFEIESAKKNYTIYTVDYLLKKYKGSRLIMVLGLDQYLDIKSWYRYEELINKVEIFCFNRGSIDIKNKITKKIKFIKDFNLDISSTNIRNYIINSDNEKLKNSIHKNVLEYLTQNNLYAI